VSKLGIEQRKNLKVAPGAKRTVSLKIGSGQSERCMSAACTNQKLALEKTHAQHQKRAKQDQTWFWKRKP
jgi:hypothetical protein